MAASATTPAVPHVHKPPRHRRWIPLSLKMLAAILLLLTAGSLWLCIPAVRQLWTIRRIQHLHGSVHITSTLPRWLPWVFTEAFDDVASVSFSASANSRPEQVTDDVMDLVVGLPNLTRLDLSKTRVTDAGLAKLNFLKRLKYVGLDHMAVTDGGLMHLSQLPALETLTVCDVELTNSGFVRIGRLEGLKVLALGGLRVTDDALYGLKNLVNLERLIMTNTSSLLTRIRG